MKGSSRVLAEGVGWRVSDIRCTAGPSDRPFEEQHDFVCLAAVTEGTFQYRSAQGNAVLAPGSVLLGNKGHCFECGHEHGPGDRCVAFHFTARFFEAVVAALPGTRRATFEIPRLPPLEPLMPLVAAAQAACEEGDGGELEELALRFAGAVAATLAEAPAPPEPSRSDARRVTDALRRIEAEPDAEIALKDLARGAGMSPYHFLRTFRRVAGMTPHQFVLRTRLHRAALRLRRTNEAVSTIAYDAGFNDLSTFNRRFKRVMGVSPGEWRRE